MANPKSFINKEDLEKAIFLVPIALEGEKENESLSEPDYNLHVLPQAAKFIEAGTQFVIMDLESNPKYAPQTKHGDEKTLMLRKLKNGATGLEYIPLFVSFQSMFAIFGQNIHVGLISMKEAKEFAKECEGIVLGPGVMNKIIPNNH